MTTDLKQVAESRAKLIAELEAAGEGSRELDLEPGDTVYMDSPELAALRDEESSHAG